MKAAALFLGALTLLAASGLVPSEARASEAAAQAAQQCLTAPMRSDFKAIATACKAALAVAWDADAPVDRRQAMLQRIGEAQYWLQDYESARGTLATLLNEAPKSAMALTWHARSELALYEFDEAAKDSLAALQLDAKCAECWRNYGAALFGGGHHAEGLAALRSALQFQPDDWVATHQLVHDQEQDGEFFDALHTLDERIARGIDADTPFFLIDKFGKAVDPLGFLLAQRGMMRARWTPKAKEALEDLDAAAARGYHHAGKFDDVTRVQVFNTLKRYQEAIALADDLLKDKTGCECRLYMEKARAYVGLQRPDEAYAAYGEAVKANPDDASTWWARGWFEAAHARPQEAHDDLVRAIGMDETLLVSFKHEMSEHDFYFGTMDATPDPGLEDALQACLLSPRCSRRVQG